MSNTCPTVKVVAEVTEDNPLGFIVINESDLTENQQIFVEEGDAGLTDNAKMTVPQIKDALTAAGIEFDSTANKGALLLLLNAGKQG
ncbi:HeH/LEM domain-containing protein [Undibacterium sp. TJN19]|uniref:HeH/LEM domain-containing protein n=1 Tax=Undibacterium sp. TJN19 TaxID=3413055 RepID=UPI003BF02F40